MTSVLPQTNIMSFGTRLPPTDWWTISPSSERRLVDTENIKPMGWLDSWQNLGALGWF
jgi:hypothetical protein